MAQKTLLSIVQQATAELNLPSPVTVVSNQDQNVQKLLTLTRAICDDLYVEYDWQSLQTRAAFTTVNGQETYTLPTGFGRFISGTFFDANNRWPMKGPKTPTEWEWMKASNVNGAPFNQFRVYGDKFYVAPIPGASVYTFNFEYITSYYVKNNLGVPKSDFTQDDDICTFDHRLVVYGLKLKFRESIGMDTSANLSDYKRALEFAKGNDVPAAKLNLLGTTNLRILTNANIPDSNWST